MNYLYFGIRYILVPVLKIVVPWGIKKLKEAKDGIPKEVAIIVIDAVAESEANCTTPDMFTTVKQTLEG